MSLKDSIKRKEIITIIGAVICFLLFAISAKLTGINMVYLANFQNTLMKFMVLGTTKLTMESSLVILISATMRVLASLVLLTAGFAFLSSYGFLKNNRDVGLIASLIAAPFIIIIFSFSVTSMFLALAIIIASMLIIPLANTYGKELNLWLLFRSNARAISTGLLILNLMLSLGIFLAISIDAAYYQAVIKDDFSATMEEIAMAELAASGDIPGSYQGLVEEQIQQRTEEFFTESLMIASFIKFLPLIVAFTVWAFLELLRMLLLPNIGGIIADILVRLDRKFGIGRTKEILNTVQEKRIDYGNKR